MELNEAIATGNIDKQILKICFYGFIILTDIE